MAVLKLTDDNEERELEFELKYQLSLTVKERFSMMEEASTYLHEMLTRYEKRSPFAIIKRA